MARRGVAVSRWLGLLAILLLLATRPTDLGRAAQGRQGSGEELAQDCTLYFEFLGRTGAGRDEAFEINPFGMGYCAGLVRGVAESANRLMPGSVCLPPETTAAQAVWVVVSYLHEHPEARRVADTTIVLTALQGAFPCP